MVVDAGGGTVDITVHKMNRDGTLTELIAPSGGDWGSTNINQEFGCLLKNLIGRKHTKVISNTEYWFDVMNSFEVCEDERE
jgi:molecular chaperone DnaK (HSP70)